MAVEVRPFGVKCNIQCAYCYQEAVRKSDEPSKSYDLARIKAAIEKAGGDFTLFGGEPLIMPVAELEALWSWGHAKYGRNAVQTNGVLINRRHIELFKKYDVRVGISVDGPGELNGARRAGSPAATLRATRKTHAAIALLVQEKIVPSIIITLHKINASADRLPLLDQWLRELDALGIRWVRLHPLEVENAEIRDQYALSEQENIAVLRHFLELEQQFTGLRFDISGDMRRLMAGRDNGTTCVWNACDPYTTRAVQGIEGRGQSSNCGRTNKDGVDFVKADRPGFERYIALYHTPQSAGGCQECRFFLVCKGQCPGTAIDGDWRNRTDECALWTSLYTDLETTLLNDGEVPLSRRPDRPLIEATMLRHWASGSNPTIQSIIGNIEAGTGAAAIAGEAAARPTNISN
jgi:uncharacterized protein